MSENPVSIVIERFKELQVIQRLSNERVNLLGQALQAVINELEAEKKLTRELTDKLEQKKKK